MRTTGARDLLLITMSHNVSFIGKTWWALMLLLRLLLLLLAGSTLFGDEQERFTCNAVQPCCSTVCFDAFSPVSVLRPWVLHLVLLCVPHALFAAYVVHEALPPPRDGGSPAPPPHLHPEREAPRFHCAYFLAVVLRVLLEVAFGAGQLLLFGLSVPQSFRCHEAPCAFGVECFVSRPTEKTMMLHLMLGLASLSVLLSLADLASTVKAAVTWRRRRRRREGSTEEEKSSAEDSGVPSTQRLGLAVETSWPPSPLGNEVPADFVLHSQLRPPLPPRPDRGPDPGTPTGGKRTDRDTVGTNWVQQADSRESPDKRAWV
ncbi:gjd4 [Pungitius sinensis]